MPLNALLLTDGILSHSHTKVAGLRPYRHALLFPSKIFQYKCIQTGCVGFCVKR